MSEKRRSEHPLPRLPLAPQWIFLTLAVVWAVLTLLVISRYHLDQPISETSITINGQTYRGSPISLTLAQSRPGLFRTFLVIMVAALGLGIGDFVLRVTRQQSRPGFGSLAGGGLAGLLSLLGLLWGVASLGVVGALLVLSARPFGVSQRAWVASRYLSPPG